MPFSLGKMDKKLWLMEYLEWIIKINAIFKGYWLFLINSLIKLQNWIKYTLSEMSMHK